MKRTLKEELERIHSLTYGKKVIEERGFIDSLLSNVGINTQKKVDDPKKADFVTSDVNDFFNTLENSSKTGGLRQQNYGSMTYQKDVETLQIGLTLLGYQLPKHGVDGLFGPETASAVQKFKQDNSILNEGATELRSTLNSLGYKEKNGEISSGGEITDHLSTIVSNILKQFKSIQPNVDVTITSGNDAYHKTVGYNSKHKTGQAIDLTLNPYNSTSKTEFEKVLDQYKSKDSMFSYINEYEKPSQKSTGGHFHLQYGHGAGVPQTNPQDVNKVTATPEMINKLIELLKQKGVKSEDLQKNIDTVTTGGGSLFTDIDLQTDEGFKKYGQICQSFINSRNPNAGISGEMMALAAKNSFLKTGKYLPPELALAQLALEGGLSKDPNAKPIRTNNPFNVGNTETGTKVFPSRQDGINSYYSLITRNYLGKNKTANDLIRDFSNRLGQKYAGPNSDNYERQLYSIASQAKKISNTIA